jgi:glutamate racemase
MIGIFDSGIGGLTVVRAVMDRLPGYDIVYFGDIARTPYGNKSAETVIGYSRQNAEFLIQQGAKIIVMACNTASSVATEALKENFALPIFEVITPAVEHALSVSRKSAVGVIGTRGTIESGIYERKIKAAAPGARVFSLPCPLLVPLVEEGWLKRPETRMIIKKYLHPLKTRQIDTLILGCTHYPLLKSIIAHKIGKRVRVIDSSTTIADKIRSFLDASPDIDAALSKNSNAAFYVSDITRQFQKTAAAIIRQPIHLKSIRL